MPAAAAAKLVGLVATVSPGAKKGSTAPYGYAKAMMVEMGKRQPRSLSGAYRKPTKPEFADAIERLELEAEHHDQVYGTHEARRMTVTGSDQVSTLGDLVQWTQESVLKGEAL